MTIYQKSPLGSLLIHGKFVGIDLSFQYLYLLVALPLIFLKLKSNYLFLISLLLASIFIGLISECFYAGTRLWVRGSVIFAWVIISSLIIIYFKQIISFKIRGQEIRNVILLSLSVSIIIIISFAKSFNPKTWRGFISYEKWSLYNWIDKNLKKDTVIISSDTQDAFLLPVYTKSRSLFTPSFMSNRSHDEEIKRYFYNRQYFKMDEILLAELKNINSSKIYKYYKFFEGDILKPLYGDEAEAIIFLTLILYYNGFPKYSNIFDSDDKYLKFLNTTIKEYINDARKENYLFDYIIFDKDNSIKSNPRWINIFENSKYILYKK